ncbi:MAG: hypothetical protein ACLROI_11150 [Beduini sp.]|uniref:hypothetical protein n=1 Tax=Beduini sp. TaxID=1922300 RepID=UPI0011C86570
MKKTILFRIGLICLALVITISGSLILKVNRTIETVDSILNQDSTIVDFQFFYSESITSDGLLNIYNFNVGSFEELEKESDLIVEVKMSHHAQPDSVFISEVQIENIFKGTCNAESLYVFEPVSIRDPQGIGFNDKYINKYAESPFYQLKIPTSWYTPMKKDEHYILFLRQAEGYEGKNIYNYVTLPYSKVPIKEEINQYVVEINDLMLVIPYSIFKSADIILPRNCIRTEDYYNQDLEINETHINDYTYVKDTYLKIIEETYQKYLGRDAKYNETIINEQHSLYQELYK